MDLAPDRGADSSVEDGQPSFDGRAGGHRRTRAVRETADKRRGEPCRRLWRLGRKTQRLEDAALFESMCDLLFPAGAELLQSPVELLAKLAVQVS